MAWYMYVDYNGRVHGVDFQASNLISSDRMLAYFGNPLFKVLNRWFNFKNCNSFSVFTRMQVKEPDCTAE